VTVWGLATSRRVGEAEHSDPAGLAGPQAAAEVVVAPGVAEGQGSMPRQLRGRLLMGWLVDDRRDRNRGPLRGRPRPRAGALAGARAGLAWALGRLERVAVVVAGAGVDRVGEEAVNHRTGPSPAPAARPPRPGGEALEELADRHPFVDQPAVPHADDVGLGLVDHEVPRHAVTLGDVAVAVGCLAGGPRA